MRRSEFLIRGRCADGVARLSTSRPASVAKMSWESPSGSVGAEVLQWLKELNWCTCFVEGP